MAATLGAWAGSVIGGRVGLARFGAAVGSITAAYAAENTGTADPSRALDRHSGDIDMRGGYGIGSKIGNR